MNEQDKEKDQEKSKDSKFINPIDPDKITEKPGTLPYGHGVGAPAFKPSDVKKMKERGWDAMQEQTDMQLNQIKEQIQLLAMQAEEIQERKELSAFIYAAEIRFQPEINHTYHLYEKKNGHYLLSMVGPDQWRKLPFKSHIATVKYIADRTWKKVDVDSSDN